MMNMARNQFSLTREASITGAAAKKQFLKSSVQFSFFAKIGGAGQERSLLCLDGIFTYRSQCSWEDGLVSQPKIRVH
jgi:hypothetical protein